MPHRARRPGLVGQPMGDQRCPLCGIRTDNSVANLTGSTQPPQAGLVYVCGYCAHVAIFTGDGWDVTAIPDGALSAVRAQPAYRELDARLRMKHYGHPTAGPHGNGIFEPVTLATATHLDPPELCS